MFASRTLLVAICIAAVHAACASFDTTSPTGQSADAASMADAPISTIDAAPGAADAPAPPIDAPATACPPDMTYCEGDVLQTCAADGSGPVAGLEQTCEFTCGVQGVARCLYASNVPADLYAACAAEARPLTPPSGASVTVREVTAGVVTIRCQGGCGGGSGNTIETTQHTNNDTAWFCLSEVDIPADVTVEHDGSLEESVVWLVIGDVDIAGIIDMSGEDGAMMMNGAGGPGGYGGGMFSGFGGMPGDGPCAGQGGIRAGMFGGVAAGGGGGGGNAQAGGTGGTGSDPFPITEMGTGGEAGMSGCGTEDLIPLVGGSGGGGGADGLCGGECGWSGGGGGGALQISARGVVTIDGAVRADGGDGYGGTMVGGPGSGGGGGGGAGGGLLIEAASLSIAGDLSVDGGDGGDSAAGPGGVGANGAQSTGADGASFVSAQEGGSGGGGGAGRIRLNAPGGNVSCPGSASPASACQTGGLPLDPQ